MSNTIGLRIKEIRKKNKDTLKTLAEKVDYDWSNLSKIERGDRGAPISLIIKISEVYDLNIAYFFDDFTKSEGNLVEENNLSLEETKEKYDFVRECGIPVTDDEILEALKLIRYLKQMK